jgi:DNA-binding IclR family transcriptional regulator
MTDAPATATATVESAARVLDVLDLLFRADFLTGLAAGEIGRELGITPASVTRYLATLRERGAIEPLHRGGHTYYRPSVRWGQYAAGILRCLDDHRRRVEELTHRITLPHN